MTKMPGGPMVEERGCPDWRPGGRSIGAAGLTLLLALTLLPAAGEAAAQEMIWQEVTISGVVVDAVTGAPIQGVTVVLSGAGFRLQTDMYGRFTLSRIRVGDYRLALSHPGYQPSIGDFTVMRTGEFVTAMEPVDTSDDELFTGIIGVVSDGAGGRPVGGATVRSTTAARGMLTDSRGAFSLTDLLPGLHLVEFTQLGYVTRTDSIRVVPDRVTNVRVSLSADPVQLDPIEVTVERREVVLQGVGFYRRQEEGFGDFIDRQEIERRGPAEMTDLFSRLPGVEMFSDPQNPLERYIVLRGGRQSSFSSGSYGRCFPRVLLDGVVVNPGGNQPAMLDQLIDPEAVVGVEVFQSSTGVPAQYGGTGASCGVIVLWTRR